MNVVVLDNWLGVCTSHTRWVGGCALVGDCWFDCKNVNPNVSYGLLELVLRETLYEDETFTNRDLAAVVASKVFFHSDE